MAVPSGDENPLPSHLTGTMDDFGMEPLYTTAQILGLANSIVASDTEWIQDAIVEHRIW
jgi:hypothetical protein